MTNRAAFSTVAVTVLENEENPAILDGRLNFLDVMAQGRISAWYTVSTGMLGTQLEIWADSIAIVNAYFVVGAAVLYVTRHLAATRDPRNDGPKAPLHARRPSSNSQGALIFRNGISQIRRQPGEAAAGTRANCCRDQVRRSHHMQPLSLSLSVWSASCTHTRHYHHHYQYQHRAGAGHRFCPPATRPTQAA